MRKFLALALLVLAACSSSDPAGTGPITSTCVPGASVSCACLGGGVGAQRCEAAGTFGECDCPTTDSGVADADAGAVDTGAEAALDAGVGIVCGDATCPSGVACCVARDASSRKCAAPCGATDQIIACSRPEHCGGEGCCAEAVTYLAGCTIVVERAKCGACLSGPPKGCEGGGSVRMCNATKDCVSGDVCCPGKGFGYCITQASGCVFH